MRVSVGWQEVCPVISHFKRQLICIRAIRSPIYKCTSITNNTKNKLHFFLKITNLVAFGRKEGFLALSHLNCQLLLCFRETCRVIVNNCNKI
jgi:hypothetical protein